MIWDLLFVDGPRANRALHVHDGSGWTRRPWADVIADGEFYAGGLRQRGVQPGDIVGAILTNSYDAVAGLLGIWLAGGVVASLPVPARGMDGQLYAAQIRDLAQSFDAPFVLSDATVARALGSDTGDRSRPVLAWQTVRGSSRLSSPSPGRDETVFIQYSSGTTSTPKGCMLSARAIGAQIDLSTAMLKAGHGVETVASWLPLSHDMGLFGCLVPSLAYGADLLLSSPERFLSNPRSWFGDCADGGATITAGPDSALRLAARMTERGGLPSHRLNLAHVVIGAEPIHPKTLDAAVAAYGPVGLKPSTFMCAYGMAEATLAVTAIGAEEEPRAVHVDGGALSEGRIEIVEADIVGATPVVSVGRAQKGVSVFVAERNRASEVRVRSTSLASGYHQDPELTASRFVEGELLTGDLGFMWDGDLYVVSRLDDMIPVNGRNVYATEMEIAIASLEKIRSGCCTVVDVPGEGRTRLVALAELTDESCDFERVSVEMSRLATRSAGVRLDECIFLARGGLPKTPSGKSQRYRSRLLARSEAPGILARVALDQ
jgi:acyl-CoA synthetase (AMP-forming)/AMP-acid ligase II